MRLLSLTLLATTASPLLAAEPAKRNVLFIVADDLRVELGCYGSPAKTPNIDALARTGVRFDRAYCQQALCNPSRSSFLTGKRPDTLRHWVNGTHFRDKNPDVVTLPQWFKQHGYETRDAGKIFHNWHTKEKGDRRSWSADEFLHYAMHQDDKPLVFGSVPIDAAKAPKCERRDVLDDAYFDGRVAAEAIRVLNEVKDKPFFLAVGFWKPHAPMNAPKKFWDLYDPAKLPALDPSRPKNAPEIAFHDGRELRGIPPKQQTFTAAESREIRHGYFANISYMDAQVGKVIAELDKLKLRDNTVIVFVADHGYHLGEHGLWAKTSCFELDARVPLIICPPRTVNPGKSTNSLVELVDLLPTLVDMCGLPVLKGIDGRSLRPIVDDPNKSLKSAAYTQHPRPGYPDRTEKGVPDAMGYSVRTEHVRYTEWRDWETGKLIGSELYDHRRDASEMTNVVESSPDKEALAHARDLLHKQFPPAIAPVKRK